MKGDCTDTAIVAFHSRLTLDFRKFFFPPQLGPLRASAEQRVPRRIKPNGGWADQRDVGLCLLFQKTTKIEDLEHYRLKIVSKMEQFRLSRL